MGVLTMILILILCSLAVSSLGSPVLGRPAVGHPRIVGGQEATPNQFPWQISLQYHIFAIGPYSHRCGATIVDDTHIVCAAHCIDGQTKGHFRVGTPTTNYNYTGVVNFSKVGCSYII